MGQLGSVGWFDYFFSIEVDDDDGVLFGWSVNYNYDDDDNNNNGITKTRNHYDPW